MSCFYERAFLFIIFVLKNALLYDVQNNSTVGSDGLKTLLPNISCLGAYENIYKILIQKNKKKLLNIL